MTPAPYRIERKLANGQWTASAVARTPEDAARSKLWLEARHDGIEFRITPLTFETKGA